MNHRNILADLERRFRRYAIRDFMRYIVIGQAIVYILLLIWPTVGYQLYGLLSLSRAGLLRGQIWRLVTFLFIPPSSSPIFIFFALYFYYMIGTSLERQWGAFRFNLFYLIGMAGAILAALLTGSATNTYLNLSLFLAYASIWPNQEVLLFMILPVKMKWLALLDLALYLWQFIQGPASVRVTIILCLLNVFLFVGGDFINTLRNEMRYFKTRQNYRNTMWR